MKETHEFLAPDYFPSFTCKMGGCRKACCTGWPVSISMKNYFDLLGLDCSEKLRTRIDCGLHLSKNPSGEEYAVISPRYDGNCPLRADDGRCALQLELGEDMIPDVCRLYPRGIRVTNGIYEISCANSCEAVPEIFFRRKEPLQFSKITLTVTMPPYGKRSTVFETFGRELDIRLFFIRLMQDRSLLFPARLMRLWSAMRLTDSITKKGDPNALDLLIKGYFPYENDFISNADLEAGLTIAEELLQFLDERSSSIRERGEKVLEFFGSKNAEEKYTSAKKHFEDSFPDWEIYYEHLFANHMFFSQFPYQDRPDTICDEAMALCATYGLLRFLCIGMLKDSESFDDLADIFASVFRLVDHTSFDTYAVYVLKKLGCSDNKNMSAFISL